MKYNHFTGKLVRPISVPSALLVFMCGAGLISPIPAAHAQEDGAAPRLEEIVVTSRRYEESVNDAPVAVNVCLLYTSPSPRDRG